MVIPVQTEPADIIRAYILCYNPILKLKPREVDVLDAMLKVYFSLKKATKAGHIKMNEIDTRLNDSMGRKVIRDLINMSEASYNNHYVQLKKKKIITEDDKIKSFLKNIDSGDISINYKIILIKPKEKIEVKLAEVKSDVLI